MPTIGSRIKNERLRLGMSRKALAAAAGMAGGTLPDLENDRSRATSKLHLIARKLGVTPEWLETGRGPKHPAQSQALGYDLDTIAAAVKILRAFLEADGRPASQVSNPSFLSAALWLVAGENDGMSDIERGMLIARRIQDAERGLHADRDEDAGTAGTDAAAFGKNHPEASDSKGRRQSRAGKGKGKP